ncbi:MAG: PD40 domain-containing protein [Candidatus Schekmanbacteria bacterium]|nr:PD40 domain-containing protein [Candidatus Schekmanbacteria bacterium]
MKHNKKFEAKILALFLIILHLSGCQRTKIVKITSNPNEAEIYFDGHKSGVTPVIKNLSFEPENKIFEVVLRKDGYAEKNLSLAYMPPDKTDYHITMDKVETNNVELKEFFPEYGENYVKFILKNIRTQAYLEEEEKSPNVKNVIRITNNKDKSVQIGAPLLSPIGDVLFFSEHSQDEKGAATCNIWKQSVDAYGKSRMTTGKWMDINPAFTPDGQEIVFSSNRSSGNHTIWSLRVDGLGGLKQVTNSCEVDDFSPAVSRDGGLITYTSIPKGVSAPQVWTVYKNGILPTQLQDGESPQISPDGKKIVFVRFHKPSQKKQIWVMNIDGTDPTQLTQNTDYDAKDPKWSNDGQWIIFSSDEDFDSRNLRNYDVWLMASDGAKKRKLTVNGSRDDCPTWDYTGKYIYFRSNRGGVWNIWRCELS